MSKQTGRLADTDEVGSRGTGFAKGDTWGPFKCVACRHFTKGEAGNVCVHPEVIADDAPTLAKRDDKGRPFVKVDDCCKYQNRGKKRADAEESGMRG